MHSSHSTRGGLRASLLVPVSFATTLLLAACGGQPYEMEETLVEETLVEETASSALLSNCPTNLYGVASGTQGSCYCPPVTWFGAVYGTGAYTSDSNLCTAAVHSGVIHASTGGQVNYVTGAGKNAFCGSARNGVTSSSYGAYGSSYSLVGGTSEIPVIVKTEELAHTYSARHIEGNYYRTYTRYSGCLKASASIEFTGSVLKAVGADGTEVVLDNVWYPIWDSYSDLGTVHRVCSYACSAN